MPPRGEDEGGHNEKRALPVVRQHAEAAAGRQRQCFRYSMLPRHGTRVRAEARQKQGEEEENVTTNGPRFGALR